MSLVGIIATSVIAALALFVLFAGIGLLIWLATRLRKDLAAWQQQAILVHAETKQLLTTSGTETKASIEAAKGAFTAIRNEVKASLEGQQKAAETGLAAHQKALAETLANFRSEMQVAIAKINAEALQTVAVRLTQVCIRAEKAIGVLQQLILDTEKSTHFDGGPEDFAPENSTFGGPPSAYSVGETARFDQEADIAQQAEQLTESPAEV